MDAAFLFLNRKSCKISSSHRPSIGNRPDSDQDRRGMLFQPGGGHRVSASCLRSPLVPDKVEHRMGGLFLRGQRSTKAPTKNTVLQDTQEHHSPSPQERHRRLVCPQRRDARGKRLLTGGSPLAEAYSSSSIFSLRTVQSSPWALVVITSMILHCLGLAVKRFGSPSACIC